MSSSVKVAVRLRPMNAKEERQGTLPVVTASSVDNTITAVRGNGRGQHRSSFSFDNVFSSYTTQEQVFAATLKPVIADVLQGFESTVFAYGQTGTGKTHTMEGDLSDPDHYGVIPRSAMNIFEVLDRPEYVSSTVTVSYLEIYNEELCDLLSDDSLKHHTSASPKKSSGSGIVKLDIMEGKDGVVCRGLTEKKVESAADVLDVMKKAQQHRKFGETKMNKHSSRSHCVFTLRLTAKKQLYDGNIFDSRGKLHLVDLAGSECAKSAALDKTTSIDSRSNDGRDEVSRERGRERSNINRSLLTLGRVIIMLKEQSLANIKKSSSANGRSSPPQGRTSPPQGRTSPQGRSVSSQGSAKKSISSYGSAKKTKSHSVRIPYRDSKLTRILQDSLGGKCKTQIIATVSPSVLSIEETMSTLSYAQSASGIINKPVAMSYISVGARSTTASTTDYSEVKSVEHWQEMETRMEYLQSQVEEAQAALARQYREQKGIIDRAEKAEEDLQITVEQLKVSDHNLKISERVLEATKETEIRLTSEAKDLMQKLETSIKDGDELHGLLKQSRDADVDRRDATKKFHSAVLEHVSEIENKLSNLENEGDIHHSKNIKHAEERQAVEHEELNESVQLLHEIQLRVSDLTMTMKSHVQDENGMMDILSKMAEDVQENVNKSKQQIESGEQKLMTSIDDTRQDLTKHSKTLLDMETEYDATLGVVVQKMESLITEANDKVANMVTTAVHALIQAREDSARTRTSLSETLASFHAASEKSVARIQDQSKKCSNQLTESLDSFTSGMKHIDNIQDELEKQQAMVDKEGVAHVEEIEKQRELVSTQSGDINTAKIEQKRLEKLFVEQILRGVTNLVNEQMNVMSSKHEEHLTLVESRNRALSTLTDGVRTSANDIITEMKATNGAIFEQSNKSRLNDQNMKTTAERANVVLADIEKISGSQREVEMTFVDQTNENANMFAGHETAIADATSALQRDDRTARTFISDSLQSDMKTGVSNLSGLTKTQGEYARNTAILSTDNQLEEMAKPRASVMSKFATATNTVLSSIAEGSDKIEKVGNKQCDTADELRGDVEMKFNGYNNDVAKRRRSTIDNRKNVITEGSTNFNKLSKDTLTSSVEVASKTKTNVSSYARKTIKFEDEVPPLDERKKIEYNPELSSTPAREVLAKDIVVESE